MTRNRWQVAPARRPGRPAERTAPAETKIQIIGFDNLKEGDTFDLNGVTSPDGPPNGAAALGDIAEALELTARNVREQAGRDPEN